MIPPMGLSPHVMSVERVQQRLRKVTAALDAAGVTANEDRGA
jgi:hypothetical protein